MAMGGFYEGKPNTIVQNVKPICVLFHVSRSTTRNNLEKLAARIQVHNRRQPTKTQLVTEIRRRHDTFQKLSQSEKLSS